MRSCVSFHELNKFRAPEWRMILLHFKMCVARDGHAVHFVRRKKSAKCGATQFKLNSQYPRLFTYTRSDGCGMCDMWLWIWTRIASPMPCAIWLRALITFDVKLNCAHRKKPLRASDGRYLNRLWALYFRLNGLKHKCRRQEPKKEFK